MSHSRIERNPPNGRLDRLTALADAVLAAIRGACGGYSSRLVKSIGVLACWGAAAKPVVSLHLVTTTIRHTQLLWGLCTWRLHPKRQFWF